MNFSTPISIPQSQKLINYDSKIIAVGSCFAENMAQKLSYFKFDTTVNPFGILFHPLAIENVIERAIANRLFTKEDLFTHHELWHSFEVHSCRSNLNQTEMLVDLNERLLSFKKSIEQATHFFITYGTAWVYEEKVTNKIVANCHKLPQSLFEKRLLSTDVIETSIQKTLQFIAQMNPNCAVIFTISPVRHIKDGFIENNRSKAHLITAVLNTISKHNAAYFPSYEIMMDELRDYRFYGNDMLHPSPLAIDFIWEKFSKSYMDSNALEIIAEVDIIQKGLNHRPFNSNSEAHLKFLENIKQKINNLVARYPHIKF